MTIADHEEVVALWTSTEGMGEAETRDELARFLDRNEGFSVVARADDALVGAVLCGHDGRRGYLYHLAVALSHRQKGVGRELAETCLSRLASIGIPRCSIHIYADNDDGEVFWRRIGWRLRTDLKVMAIDLKVV